MSNLREREHLVDRASPTWDGNICKHNLGLGVWGICMPGAGGGASSGPKFMCILVWEDV